MSKSHWNQIYCLVASSASIYFVYYDRSAGCFQESLPFKLYCRYQETACPRLPGTIPRQQQDHWAKDIGNMTPRLRDQNTVKMTPYLNQWTLNNASKRDTWNIIKSDPKNETRKWKGVEIILFDIDTELPDLGPRSIILCFWPRNELYSAKKKCICLNYSDICWIPA